jgi:uncharacterized protein YggT (Ycf19 family)
MDASSSPRTQPLYRGTQVVWYIAGILEALLAFRFALKLLGANSSAGFTSFIYQATYPFTAPFLNVFRVSRVEGSVFEWTTLLAMLVFWLVAQGVVRLLVIGKPVSTSEAAVKLDSQDGSSN